MEGWEPAAHCRSTLLHVPGCGLYAVLLLSALYYQDEYHKMTYGEATENLKTMTCCLAQQLDG